MYSSGLVVQQISNGRQLLFLIYTGLVANTSTNLMRSYDYDSGLDGTENLILKECNLEYDPIRVQKFLDTFSNESREAELSAEGEVEVMEYFNNYF